jgi:hypothetical protein
VTRRAPSRLRWTLATAIAAAALACPATAAAAAQTHKKAIWGPATAHAFRTYDRLGVGIYELALSWRAVARSRPANPTDPADPAYVWPAAVDKAIGRARRHDIDVLLMLIGTPPWANGGRGANWVPDRPSDLADFAAAAARRYPAVRRWMVWGEPTRQPNFMPLDPESAGKPLTAAEARAPRYYARMLDASYGALKGVRRRNIVIGGNSYTTGDISPLNWIRYMRLPDGRRPRMDMYGHNPFSLRRPDLSQSLFRPGNADFSDLDALWGWLDRYGYRDRRGRRLRLFLSEFTLPTEHANHEFNFWVTRKVQASWLSDALRIVRRRARLATLGWIALKDDPPRADGQEVNRGLVDINGRRKPSFYAYRDG